MSALLVDALDVPFGDGPGLTGVSFGVQPGERLVVVGASGAGKTSLLSALAGFLRPSSGRIVMGGEDVTGSPPERRPCVLLAQTPLLFPHLTVFENVGFPLSVRRVGASEIRTRVDAALASVRMDGFGDRRPATLSGGQVRRIALARAMVARPSVLLLDEPLSALDPALREDMRRMILEVHAEQRPALVMVTHDLTEAGRVADRIGVLVSGALEQVGSPGEVFRRPATLEVARFIGLRNELAGAAHADGAVFVGDARVLPPRSTSVRSGEGIPTRSAGTVPVDVVFGVEGARLVPAAEVGAAGVLPARVEAAVHAPEGVTVRLTTDHGPVEIRVDAEGVPATGSTVSLELRRDAAHVYVRSVALGGGTPPPGSPVGKSRGGSFAPARHAP